jgi:hypothetical protein
MYMICVSDKLEALWIRVNINEGIDDTITGYNVSSGYDQLVIRYKL